MAVDDFNGDGKPDLAVANYGSNTVGVILGNSTGGFAAATTFSSGGSEPRSVGGGDFNGDGRQDLVVANYGSGTVGVLWGNGSGGFAAAKTFSTGGSEPGAVAVWRLQRRRQASTSPSRTMGAVRSAFSWAMVPADLPAR